MLIVLLVTIGAAGELYRLLTSDEALTPRLLISRLLLGALASLSVLTARVHKPDMEDVTLIGCASVVAVLGYSFMEKPLKTVVRRVFQALFSGGKHDDSQ